MKKIYQIPTTSIVNIELTSMIAQSPQMYGKNAESAAMGRRESSTFWDEGEEE